MAAAANRLNRMIRRGLGIFSAGVLLLLLAVWWLTQPLWPWQGDESRHAVAPEVSQQVLRDHVRVLSEQMPPRDYDADVLDQVAAYIRSHFARYSTRVYDQPFDVSGITYRNVRAEFGATDGERIVIGAHYDTADGLPGADDNASGIAGVLELARLLQGFESEQVTVELVAYTLEEPPYFRSADMGSRHHADALVEAGTALRLMVSLEMIGYFDDAAGSQQYPLPFLRHFYPERGDFIAVVGNLTEVANVRRVKRTMRAATPLPVHSINAPAWIPGIDFSDHQNYWRHGLPAVMITDTAQHRNRTYHTREDTWQRLDYRRMAQVVQGVYAVVLDYAAR